MAKRRKDGAEVEWDFFSFPVFFAFALGAFLAVLLYPFGIVIFVLSLFGVSFGIAHIAGHTFRKRSADRRRQREEEDERERRALAARAANLRAGEIASVRRRRRRGGQSSRNE
jgi:hypothetical protein